MSDSAISVSGLCKNYPAYLHRPRTLKETVLSPAARVRRQHALPALTDVSFEVGRGRTVGVIGHNGAGKSTLLRLVAGVGRPDAGRIDVRGRVAALFELGTGLHPDLTGRENVVIAGVISGLTRREVLRRLPDVAAFAELERVLDAPLRTYSTGMQARLAFSVATHVEPDVLLVDEVLAVGDIGFQARCIDRLRRLQRAGTTIVLVSHDPALVADLCDEVLWLRGGRLVGRGSPQDVTDSYRNAMAAQARTDTPVHLPDAGTPAGRAPWPRPNRFGTQDARVERVHVTDAWGGPCRVVRAGTEVRLAIEVDLPWSVGPVNLSVTLDRGDGVRCMDTSTVLVPEPSRARCTELSIGRLDLAAGRYAFTVGLYSPDWTTAHDVHEHAYPLEVDGPRHGERPPVLGPPLTWTVHEGAAWSRRVPRAVPRGRPGR